MRNDHFLTDLHTLDEPVLPHRRALRRPHHLELQGPHQDQGVREDLDGHVEGLLQPNYKPEAKFRSGNECS